MPPRRDGLWDPPVRFLSFILIWRQEWACDLSLCFTSTSPPVKPKVQTSATFTGRHHWASGPGSGWAAGYCPASLAGVKCRLLRRKAAAEGRRAAHPRGLSLRSSAGNIGRVPLVRYVWINIISLRPQADFANCASAGAAGLEGVHSHQAIPRLPTLALHGDQLLALVSSRASLVSLSLAQE